jgi:hypothetical protein
MKKHLSNQTRKRMLSILGMLLLSVPFVLAQVLVKGTVKDNLGEGVPGASVQVKGTSQGTITDLDGKFTLNIPQKNATLVISFIGYVTVEQKADSQKPMVITLKEDTKTLDEVVVVGYQEVRRRDLTGSVAKANMADVLTAPVASFDQALGGRIAGVNVTSGEGMPGGNMSIVIRGNTRKLAAVRYRRFPDRRFIGSQHAEPFRYRVARLPQRCVGYGHLRCARCQRCCHHHHQER